MLNRVRPHLTYANVVSTLCLFILLGGSAYAATTIGSKQIANNSVQGKDIKNGSVTGKDVKKKSLTAGLFKSGELPRGATGGPGPQGATGLAGAAGATNVTVRTKSFTVSANSSANQAVSCASGERATGGGAGRSPYLGVLQGSTGDSAATGPLVGTSPAQAGQTPDGWAGTINATSSGTFVLYVVCARP